MCPAAVLYNEFTRIAAFMDWRDTMAEGPYTVRRTNPRFSFFADAEVTLRDGTGVRAQLAELSSRGCYIDTLEPIPIRTKLRLRICDGMNTCELRGKVLYMHSGGGFGIFGMGVLFEEMGPEQRSAIDAWLRVLAGRAGKDFGKTSFSQIRG
jgi:PilZ domain